VPVPLADDEWDDDIYREMMAKFDDIKDGGWSWQYDDADSGEWTHPAEDDSSLYSSKEEALEQARYHYDTMRESQRIQSIMDEYDEAAPSRHTISTKLTETQRASLDEYCEANGETISTVLRQALARMLGWEEDEMPSHGGSRLTITREDSNSHS
jgi:hypothetical protein